MRYAPEVGPPARDAAAIPGVVMVARGSATAALVLPAEVTLGRWIVTGGQRHDLDDDRMSREHATVRFERGAWIVKDRGSRNGTFLDGVRLTGELRRRGDHVLRLGHTVFVLLSDARGHPAPEGAAFGPELARAHECARAAVGDTLLILGDRGTDREQAARLFHDAGPRAAGPFIPVSCPAMPEGVAERLLFGGERGVVHAIGHFQMARGGTIYLDDVASLDAAVQAKLLRLCERRELEPVGATARIPIDVGIVAGGHDELRVAVADRRFDAELYRRLATDTVQLPPLRARKVDIARLVQRELAAARPTLVAHARFLEACLIRTWPGSACELAAAVRRAADLAVAAGRDVVRSEDLDATAGLTTGALGPPTAVERAKPDPAVLDRPTIEAALARAQGDVNAAARALGLHRSQLYRLMDDHEIVHTDEG